ncbi:MAG: hypothetical protein K2H28_04775 [Ruminococcus sp.]|nr:hypothetical protein [Ruminococcus sp.]
MKTKKFISAVMAVAMVASTMTAFSAFAVDPDAIGNGMLNAIPFSFDENNKFTSDAETFWGGDNDWFSFSLDTATKINTTIEVKNRSNGGNNAKFYLEIIDADNDNTKVFTSKDLVEKTHTLIFYLNTGNYYIHFYTEAVAEGDYQFQLQKATVEDSFDALSNNSISKASAVEFDTEYTGHLYDNDEVDYYTFDLAEEGMVTINFDSSLDDVDWKIYNSDKETVEEGTFSKTDNNEADSEISAVKSYVMTAGTFTLGIMKHDASEKSYGNYTLSLDYLKDYNNRAVSGVFACVDVTKDGFIDARDAGAILSYYAYLSTGGKETDFNVWYETEFAE